jgi:thiol:disulfide interchange protein DsbC
MSSLLASAALLALFPAAVAEGASVEEAIAAKIPGVEAKDIRPTAVPGLYEVAVGAQVVYISADARYMLRGELVDMMNGQNLTEQRLGELRLAALKGLDEKRMVIFPASQQKHVVTVVTDIDCGYCRRLHREIHQYNDLGITVRYMFMPLAGRGSDSWAKAEAVWCSPDRNDAMTRAKLGEEIKMPRPCVNTPVADHHRAAQELGVRGTPAIITADGELIGGYVPAERLSGWLDER